MKKLKNAPQNLAILVTILVSIFSLFKVPLINDTLWPKFKLIKLRCNL